MFARADTYIRANRNLDTARELLKKYLTAHLTPDDPPRSQAEKLLLQVEVIQVVVGIDVGRAPVVAERLHCGILATASAVVAVERTACLLDDLGVGDDRLAVHRTVQWSPRLERRDGGPKRQTRAAQMHG